ncbi:Lsr2 family protein [Rhodococcus sp. X156]|uniref:histone-like nucleoid-structuring protein Lsr2 n=1 Tax=Rhodococcus sp. X156 TaxID=2499145 RepID=UPI000FD7DD9D|nr:Lsr2 family protein [Rhodococcus sp. X156]
MSQKVTVTFVDDIDDELAADETVEFSVDGVNYSIDLSADNAQKLRNDFAMWIAHARKESGRKRTSRGSTTKGRASVDREQSAAIREWARRSGHEVSDRGRIPAAIIEAYHQAS